MRFLTELHTKLCCKKIGHDEFGNQYYESKKGKRIVLYKGIVEPSKIPAEWHVWIHYITNNPPVNINTHRYCWQKVHLPNLTGTTHSHHPQSSQSVSDKITKGTYQAWNPNQN